MTLIPLNPPPGINSDDTTFAAEGRWADGNNMRFHEGRPEVIGKMATFNTNFTGLVNSIFAWKNGTTGTISLVYGSPTVLYVGSAITGAAQTPASLPVSVASWSLDAWGTSLLVNPQGGKLYVTADPTATATHVTQAPAVITSMLVTQERQVLALGCNEEVSGTFNNLCIRGSDIEDYTDWTSTATNNAFEHILEGAGGAIVAGMRVGQYIAVLTTSSLYSGQFIGDPSQTYRFDKIASGCGLIGPKAFAVSDGTLYWVGTDLGVRTWAPGSLPARIPTPVSTEFERNITAALRSKVMVSTAANFNEIWIFYADGRDSNGATYNTRYIAYAITESIAAQRPVWFRGQLERTAILDSPLVQDSLGGGVIVTVDGGGDIIHHEAAGGSQAFSAYIQSADQYIDNSQRRMMIRGVIPDFEDQAANVSLTLYVRERPQSAATTKGPYTLTTEASGYLVNDTMASGDTVVTVDTGTGGIASGREITFAGVNSWENGADSGALAKFTLTADYAGGNGNISFTPAMISSGGTRNVVALAANNAAIMVLGTASKKDFRASGKIMAVKFSTASGTSPYFRLGKPCFDVVPTGER